MVSKCKINMIKHKFVDKPYIYIKQTELIHKDWLEPEYEMTISQKNHEQKSNNILLYIDKIS